MPGRADNPCVMVAKPKPKKPALPGARASIYEAKTHFSALVARAKAGEEIDRKSVV